MRAFGFAFLLITAVACSDRPSRERFPGPPGRTTEMQNAQTQRAVLGGTDSLNNPLASGDTQRVAPHAAPNDGANPGGAPVAAGASIHGRVQLAKGAKPAGRFLFISVRPAEGGPPLVARKLIDPTLPYEFTLSAADVMIPGTPFEGEVDVTARLKSEQDPLSRADGDISATVRTKVGDQKVSLELK